MKDIVHSVDFTNSERLFLLKAVNEETRKAQNGGKVTIKRLELLYGLQDKLKMQGVKPSHEW